MDLESLACVCVCAVKDNEPNDDILDEKQLSDDWSTSGRHSLYVFDLKVTKAKRKKEKNHQKSTRTEDLRMK